MRSAQSHKPPAIACAHCLDHVPMVLYGLLTTALVGEGPATDWLGLCRVRPNGVGEKRIAAAAVDSLVQLIVAGEQLQKAACPTRCLMTVLDCDKPLDQFVRTWCWEVERGAHLQGLPYAVQILDLLHRVMPYPGAAMRLAHH